MRVKRVSYVKRNGVVRRFRKVVLEVVEPDAYVAYTYWWSEITSSWEPVKGTAYFDGTVLKEVGVLHMKENVKHYINLLTRYSGFEYMKSDEDNKDTNKEDKYLEEISKDESI